VSVCSFVRRLSLVQCTVAASPGLPYLTRPSCSACLGFVFVETARRKLQFDKLQADGLQIGPEYGRLSRGEDVEVLSPCCWDARRAKPQMLLLCPPLYVLSVVVLSLNVVYALSGIACVLLGVRAQNTITRPVQLSSSLKSLTLASVCGWACVQG
jgi:hypothetical protein